MKGKRLQYALILGGILGLAVPITSMALTGHRSEAAVAVFDARNVEEAIKTAISTAEILTTEQKELALKILDAKKIDISILQDLAKSNQKANQVLSEDKMYEIPNITPILSKNSTTEAVLLNQIGSIEDMFNGNKTVVDVYNETMKNHRVMDATYRAAAKQAENVQRSNQILSENVEKTLELIDKAEGESQILQGQAYLMAQNYYMNRNTNEMIAQLLAMNAENWYVNNREKAQQERIVKDFAERVGGIKD